jgi:asparagine synthase (glutamine-hydrolysing)
VLLGKTGVPADAPGPGGRAILQRLGNGPASASVFAWGVPALDAEERWAADPATGSWLALSGHVFMGPEAGRAAPRAGAASRLLARLLARGPEAVADFEGTFALAWWDAGRGRLYLIRDAFGIEPLFFAEVAGDVIFASRVADLAASGLVPGGLSAQGLLEFLTWSYVPGDATLDRNVARVPAGSWLAAEPGRGVVERGRWYRLSFAEPFTGGEAEIGAGFRERLRQAVARRLGPTPTGAFVSGGMDSSSIVSLVRGLRQDALHTFSFRCSGQSFDESTYARALARELGTTHLEVEYGEEQALQKEQAVREMDVPLCDVGIVTASWLLGGAAGGRVPFVFTGDGGDEMWGSHPVYAAQRIVALYERLPVPRPLERAFRRAVAGLSDSSRKRDLRVKLKRILPPEELPRSLGPFRWRVTYAPEELATLLTPEAAALVRGADPYASVLEAYDGYDGPDDGLSPHLYNDYRTLSGFYFSRLRLLRRFGLEVRCPFYDRELVEYGARIPGRLKLEGLERTKRLYRAAMKGVLPDVIRERRDKLGHSVPLKNWLRGDGRLAARVAEVLAPDAIRRRGLFRPEAVARMLSEHRRMRENHSHRIWSLYVLEMWLRGREP